MAFFSPRGSRSLRTRRLRADKRTGTSSRSSSGFTLIEISIALGILSVGLLGVAAATITAMAVSTQSRERTQASYLAQQQLEIFRMTPEAGLLAVIAAGTTDPSNPIDPDPNDGDTRTYDRRWLIQADTPETGVYTLTVFVDWVDDRGVTRTQQLTTLAAPS